MSGDREAWNIAGTAWDRLGRWFTRRSPQDDPLSALGDIGVVRRLLDEVELEAVRAARRQARSWAEIATKLGVTRQSAWERWRDLDDAATGDPEPETAAEGRAAGVLDRIARRASRGAVRVPNVVGMTFEDAVTNLAKIGLAGVAHDPDSAAPDLLGHLVVTDQSPESGARAAVGSQVRLWTEREGGAGVREPRRPRPSPRTGRKMLDEPTGEAVG